MHYYNNDHAQFLQRLQQFRVLDIELFKSMNKHQPNNNPTRFYNNLKQIIKISNKITENSNGTTLLT